MTTLFCTSKSVCTHFGLSIRGPLKPRAPLSGARGSIPPQGGDSGRDWARARAVGTRNGRCAGAPLGNIPRGTQAALFCWCREGQRTGAAASGARGGGARSVDSTGFAPLGLPVRIRRQFLRPHGAVEVRACAHPWWGCRGRLARGRLARASTAGGGTAGAQSMAGPGGSAHWCGRAGAFAGTSAAWWPSACSGVGACGRGGGAAGDGSRGAGGRNHRGQGRGCSCHELARPRPAAS